MLGKFREIHVATFSIKKANRKLLPGIEGRSRNHNVVEESLQKKKNKITINSREWDPIPNCIIDCHLTISLSLYTVKKPDLSQSIRWNHRSTQLKKDSQTSSAVNAASHLHSISPRHPHVAHA